MIWTNSDPVGDNSLRSSVFRGSGGWTGDTFAVADVAGFRPRWGRRWIRGGGAHDTTFAQVRPA